METKTNTHLSDTDIKNNVLLELKFEPSVRTSDIGVLVKDGTVTLNGNVSSYAEKRNAIRATKRLAGVNGIADDIQVKLPGTVTHTDSDIASSAAHQIKWASSVPHDKVTLTVREGWVTLEGDVEWWFERNAAERAVQYLGGVKGVVNEITIKPKLSALSIGSDIESAFKRSAMLDAEEVAVTTSGNTVILRGKVRTYAEKQEAERVAWAAPGVLSVMNELSVNWGWLGD